jgi:hypothetical protein
MATNAALTGIAAIIKIHRRVPHTRNAIHSFH